MKISEQKKRGAAKPLPAHVQKIPIPEPGGNIF
jgi:hypothetical protein